MSKISVSQAAKLTGKSRETINKATKSGKLAFTLNGSNHKEIDVAELERVYPFVKTVEEINKEPKAVKPSQSVSEPDIQAELATLREKIAGSEKTNELLLSERDRERRQLESEIDNLRNSLEKAQEQHGKALLLITDQTKKSESERNSWQEPLETLKTKVANQQRDHAELKENARKRIAQLKKELEQERSKSFFAKLFG